MSCYNLVDGLRESGTKSCLDCITIVCEACFSKAQAKTCPKCRAKNMVNLSLAQRKMMEKVKLNCGPCNKVLNLLEFYEHL